MASFVLSLFPLDVLDEIWDLIESVSEGFLTYCFRCLAQFTSKQYCLGQEWFFSNDIVYVVSIVHFKDTNQNTSFFYHTYLRKIYPII